VALVLPWVIGIGGGLLLAVAAGIVDFSDRLSGEELHQLMTGPATAALGLGTVALTWPILWALVRLIQHRPLATVLGVGGRLCGGDFVRGAAAVALALAPGAVWNLIFVDIERSPIPLSDYLIWLAPLLILLLAQCSAEELLFRGFLPQSLAARFRSPHVWIVYPMLLFVLLHYDAMQPLEENVRRAIGYVTFSALALLTVARTGGLGAAIGIHFASNIYAMLIVGNSDRFLQQALYVLPGGDDVAPVDFAVTVAFRSLYFAIAACTLFHPRSPLRLRAPAPAPSPTASDHT
jgi:membrane protease YdiL (CAAX protease family)